MFDETLLHHIGVWEGEGLLIGGVRQREVGLTSRGMIGNGDSDFGSWIEAIFHDCVCVVCVVFRGIR